MDYTDVEKADNAMLLFQKNFPEYDYSEFIQQLCSEYKIKSFNPLRLTLKDSKNYKSKVWGIDNPRYFYFKAAAKNDYLNSKALIRVAIDYAVNFWRGHVDDLNYSLQDFAIAIAKLQPVVLREFCKHNHNFQFRMNQDGEYKIIVKFDQFDFDLHEQLGLLAIQAAPPKIIDLSVARKDNKPEPEVKSKDDQEEEIDWGAIIDRTGLDV